MIFTIIRVQRISYVRPVIPETKKQHRTSGNNRKSGVTEAVVLSDLFLWSSCLAIVDLWISALPQRDVYGTTTTLRPVPFAMFAI
jgi:hypothetical protein